MLIVVKAKSRMICCAFIIKEFIDLFLQTFGGIGLLLVASIVDAYGFHHLSFSFFVCCIFSVDCRIDSFYYIKKNSSFPSSLIRYNHSFSSANPFVEWSVSCKPNNGNVLTGNLWSVATR